MPQDIQKVYFRKNGFLIDNLKADKYYWTKQLRVLFQFIFDIGLFLTIMMVSWFVLGVGFWNSVIICVGLFWVINVGSLIIFKDRTLGMLFAGLKITSSDGGPVSKAALIWRGMASSIHVLPIIGQIFSVCSFFVVIFTHGISPIDLITKTIIVDKWTAVKMKNIYANFEEE